MKYFIIAGEASGDLHASHLMHEIKKQDHAAEFMFLGGDLMQAEGGTMVQHYRKMAFMGFVTVIRNIRKVLNNVRMTEQALLEFQPDKLILIDYPSFNLKMAKYAKEHLPETEVIYYISPKLWAWKSYRFKGIKRYIDSMYTIFPFETEFYRQYNYKVTYVGNPTYDNISKFTSDNPIDPSEFRKENKLSGKPIIALLAGSRKQEVSRCLPKMIEAARAFDSSHQIVIAGAPGLTSDFYANYAKGTPVIFDKTYTLLQQAEAAIVNSGTATLETAIVGTPQVVVYSVYGGRLAYMLKPIFIKTKYISLVNIIAQKEVVKELVAHLFTVKNVEEELRKLLQKTTYRHKMLEGYAEIKGKLAQEGNGAAQNAARHITQSRS